MYKKAPLGFASAHGEKDEDSILQNDEPKINVFGTDGFKNVWLHKDEEYKEKCMVSTGGGSILMWGFISAAGVWELHFIDGIMKSQMYCSMLKEKMLPLIRSLGCHARIQYGNDPYDSKFWKLFLFVFIDIY